MIDGIQLGQIKLGRKHARIVCDRAAGIRVLTGGYGSGKSHTGAICVLDLGLRYGHLGPILATEPTYGMVKDVMVPTVEKICSEAGIPCRWKVAAHVFQIGKHKKFEIWCRGLDKPRSCEGINAIGYWGDEWELTKYESFIPALQRVRVGPCLTTILTGTPEGFNKNYKAILQPDNRLASTREYILSTRDNPFLPSNYYEDSKKRLMTTEAILEKLEGIRTPKGGRVYSRFNKENNAMTLRAMARFQRTRYAIACDFNVNYMHFLIAEIDDNLKAIKIIDEVIHEGGTTTDQHVRRTMDRLIQITGKPYDELVRMRIRAYCDSYGSARSAVTEKSNFTLVQQGGFVVDAPSKNPPVEDRINAVQCLFRDHRLYIGPNCQTLMTNFETQTYDEKTGEPDKKNNIDHGIDGGGYMCARLYPVAVRKPRDYNPEKYESDEWGIL